MQTDTSIPTHTSGIFAIFDMIFGNVLTCKQTYRSSTHFQAF